MQKLLDTDIESRVVRKVLMAYFVHNMVLNGENFAGNVE